MMDRVNRIVDILEGVADGTIDAGTVLEEEWREYEHEPDKLITSAWHELHHFQADADIRERDAAYAESQKATLISFAQEIRQKYSLLNTES